MGDWIGYPRTIWSGRIRVDCLDQGSLRQTRLRWVVADCSFVRRERGGYERFGPDLMTDWRLDDSWGGVDVCR
jgi:hypothetical protein